jgi:hypothetical protein
MSSGDGWVDCRQSWGVLIMAAQVKSTAGAIGSKIELRGRWPCPRSFVTNGPQRSCGKATHQGIDQPVHD